MSALPESKYHLREQQADALLAPIAADIRATEQRVRHYLDRVRLGDSDEEALRAAHDVLADAAEQIDRILRESREITRE